MKEPQSHPARRDNSAPPAFLTAFFSRTAVSQPAEIESKGLEQFFY
jgi:hypothetical protein